MYITSTDAEATIPYISLDDEYDTRVPLMESNQLFKTLSRPEKDYITRSDTSLDVFSSENSNWSSITLTPQIFISNSDFVPSYSNANSNFVASYKESFPKLQSHSFMIPKLVEKSIGNWNTQSTLTPQNEDAHLTLTKKSGRVMEQRGSRYVR